MVIRAPWGKFPPVITHTNRAAIDAHPDSAAARSGDLDRARRVVRLLAKPELVAVRFDHVCPVIPFDVKGGWNALPVALAERIAEHSGATLVPGIIQEKAGEELPTDSITRIIGQSGFVGEAPKGRYLICHDVCTFGSAIANLRGHLMEQGATVVGATALAANVFSATLVPDSTVLSGIAGRFRHELSTITTHLGFEYDRLTAREAYFIYGLKNLECIRNPLAPSHRVAGPRF